MDRARFFAVARASLFSGRLGLSQVAGMEAILDAWQRDGADGDPRKLAYMLATAFHETAATMQPVRETRAETDDGAIAILDNAFRKGRLSSVREPYWRRDAEGKSWLGRGLVQLTHKQNYQRMARETGIDLVADPAKAMDLDIAVRILFAGMRKGLFTGRRLDDYFRGEHADWANARRIINGTDRMELVAGYARIFHRAIV